MRPPTRPDYSQIVLETEFYQDEPAPDNPDFDDLPASFCDEVARRFKVGVECEAARRVTREAEALALADRREREDAAEREAQRANRILAPAPSIEFRFDPALGIMRPEGVRHGR